ncbi:MAG TPA: 2,3-bisphosphoglycerate-independent phosphoglycerate mutase, partial [Gemmatimonadetes bacterium]|nr:2,3-bisphosphoglycerate-independent phosphoglycerate mutase [Gemmatimonadota bacterium]
RDDFDEFKRSREGAGTIVSMTEYEEGLPVTVAFPTDNVHKGLSEHLSSLGKRQLKVAETEKYAHVTYFFNGGEEAPFMGEDRSLVPSPRVATYDLHPEMSARGVTRSVIAGLKDNYDFILV